jgi:hypothetical protein
MPTSHGEIPVSFLGWSSRVDGWEMERVETVAGAQVDPVASVTIVERVEVGQPPGCEWVLRGRTGAAHYLTPAEEAALVALSPPLGRPQASCAALIPIGKSQAWWELPQPERRRIFEDSSRHATAGRRVLPAVARRLYHSRALGEPFDFLTWFEFAPEDVRVFDDLLRDLRASEEWTYVEREVELRLVRA